MKKQTIFLFLVLCFFTRCGIEVTDPPQHKAYLDLYVAAQKPIYKMNPILRRYSAIVTAVVSDEMNGRDDSLKRYKDSIDFYNGILNSEMSTNVIAVQYLKEVDMELPIKEHTLEHWRQCDIFLNNVKLWLNEPRGSEKSEYLRNEVVKSGKSTMNAGYDMVHAADSFTIKHNITLEELSVNGLLD
ncbi:hypothetical protein CJD36_005395 [Flavipsychrobacter stenotrophus]|uniref:Uncharacterized protein n=1 Tax=Flavipsychrobacter stenotrophus TaxID=2077091 RepID=A0A2S7SWD2_9BACT|nr:hypothetical protein [Flavipsychrobacter stenotrophus]PQJ11242.1 hypothetical protein CJD36_005395 [Flavipsychrobacter stenotrophus]